MSGFLKRLNDNQAMLLLYLSGEMSPVDRAEVERRLAVDETLRAQLTELQVAHAVYLQAMKSLTAATPAPLSEDAAAQRACRATRQWAVRRLAHPSPAGGLHLLLPRWTYPVAAAAAILVALTSWSVNHHFQWWTSHQQDYKDFTPETALNDPTLTLDQQNFLLDAVGGDDSAQAATPLDEADTAIASLQNSDDQDALSSSPTNATNNQEGTR